MNWITVFWSINAGACLTLATSYGAIWYKHIKTNGRGMGLRIMRYRAQCIGGSCEVRPAANRGTIICCRVPLEMEPSLSTMS